jgi:hypothetical protein
MSELKILRVIVEFTVTSLTFHNRKEKINLFLWTKIKSRHK